MVLLYFASETAGNEELRQCLSYFFPVYCYSSSQNQRRMSRVRTSDLPGPLHPVLCCSRNGADTRNGHNQVLLTALGLLKGVYEDLSDRATMIAPLQIGLQLIDWCDPQKVVV
jgi:condensin complex subunit 3